MSTAGGAARPPPTRPCNLHPLLNICTITKAKTAMAAGAVALALITFLLRSPGVSPVASWGDTQLAHDLDDMQQLLLSPKVVGAALRSFATDRDAALALRFLGTARFRRRCLSVEALPQTQEARGRVCAAERAAGGGGRGAAHVAAPLRREPGAGVPARAPPGAQAAQGGQQVGAAPWKPPSDLPELANADARGRDPANVQREAFFQRSLPHLREPAHWPPRTGNFEESHELPRVQDGGGDAEEARPGHPGAGRLPAVAVHRRGLHAGRAAVGESSGDRDRSQGRQRGQQEPQTQWKPPRSPGEVLEASDRQANCHGRICQCFVITIIVQLTEIKNVSGKLIWRHSS